MAKPVIDTRTSVLGYPQYLDWSFQPFATNNPTSWTISGLPAGKTFDPATGKISGPATEVGVFHAPLVAINADGASDPLDLAISIGAAAAPLNFPGIQFSFDAQSKKVTFTGIESAGDVPALFAKVRDDILMAGRVMIGDQPASLVITEFTLGIKQFSDEKTLAVSLNQKLVGAGASSYYALRCSLAGNKAVEAAVKDRMNRTSAFFDGRAELEIVCENPIPDFGAATLRITSQDFPIRIALDAVQA